MYQAKTDLTLPEVLTDPLIRAMMRADGVQMAEFKDLLFTAASAMRRDDAARAPAGPVDTRSAADGLFAGRLLAVMPPAAALPGNACVACA